MLKCMVCGKTYNPRYRFGFADDYSCPNCGEDEDYQWQCVECDTLFKNEDLIGDLCPKCLREKLTLKTGRDFLVATGYMADFVFNIMLGTGEVDTVQDKCSADRKTVNEWADGIFTKGVVIEAMCGTERKNAEVLEKLRGYILDADESFAFSFSQWLTDRANWVGPYD